MPISNKAASYGTISATRMLEFDQSNNGRRNLLNNLRM